MLYCITILSLVLIRKIGSVQDSTTIENLNEISNDASNEPSKNEVNKFENKQLENFENASSFRIVGGEKCFIEDYPWIVSLRTSRRLTHYCGGALISSRWVLSAAHCFEKTHKYPWMVTAMVGLSTLRRKRSQAIVVKKIFVHRDYDPATITDDIALLVLKRRVSLYLGAIGFMKLPDEPFPSDLSKYCPAEAFMVAGWGSQLAYSHEPPPYRSSPHLMCVQVPFIDNQACQKFDAAAKNERVICTLYAQGGKDACQGDSGGPLFCRGVQYGIVSWGHGCAVPNSPGFYTRVDRYLDFIDETVKNYVDSSEYCHKNNFYLIMIVFISTYV